jgi:hypothetical protein
MEKEEIKNPWFWGYVIAMIVLASSLKFNFNSIALKEIIFILFPIVQFIYNKKVKISNKFQKNLSWIFFVILTLFALTYLFAINKEILMTAFLFILVSLFIITSVVILTFQNMLKSKNIPQIIINYIIFSFVLILLFAFFYALFSGWEINKIINSENNSVKGTWDFIYFSSSVFYTSVINYIPNGWSKLIVQIELVVSFIVHTILIGNIIPEIIERKKLKKELSIN